MYLEILTLCRNSTINNGYLTITDSFDIVTPKKLLRDILQLK